MELIQGKTRFALPERTAVAIGKFDGVHLGHRRLLGEILSRRDGFRSAVFTFDPSVGTFFSQRPSPELTTREEKRVLFAEMGVDYLIEFPLNADTAAMPPDVFIRDILAGQLRAGLIAAGPDLSFGHRGAGDVALLQKMAAGCGYRVRIVPKLCLDGTPISSTRLREEVMAGHMETAARLVGSPYQLCGRVEHGARLGRKLGFPTLNLRPPLDKLLPPYGVYSSKVLYAGKKYNAITNIGTRPSVTSDGETLAETYVYDFSSEIYGEQIAVQLLSFKRPEQKFQSREALRERLRRDIMEGDTEGRKL